MKKPNFFDRNKTNFHVSALYLHVTLMGMGAFLGGMMTLTPECLQPRMAPPRASTMKLTRNLRKAQEVAGECSGLRQEEHGAFSRTTGLMVNILGFFLGVQQCKVYISGEAAR